MWNKIVIKHGIGLFLGLIAYYLIMQILGLSNRYDFRIFNAVIQIGVLYLAIKEYAKSKPEDFNYLSGTVIGINTSVVGVLPFAIFQMINLYLNPQLLEFIQQNAPVVGPYVNPFSGGLIVFVEGLAVGLVISYICMRVVELQSKEYGDKLQNGNHERLNTHIQEP
ncbi:MAG: hypothetical protein IPL46_17320 [Saprospiraceae bacterium]|nr:hypothetical protein [Saprospiraceae bacterium]